MFSEHFDFYGMNINHLNSQLYFTTKLSYTKHANVNSQISGSF